MSSPIFAFSANNFVLPVDQGGNVQEFGHRKPLSLTYQQNW